MSKQAFDKGHEQFVAAMRAGDATALVGLLTDDVTFCPPHEATRTGKSEVKAWAQQMFSQFKTEWMDTPDREVVVTGDWAFERGLFIWAVAPTGGGATIEDRGRFIAIWQRQSDGSWKIAYDLWNSSKPVART